MNLIQLFSWFFNILGFLALRSSRGKGQLGSMAPRDAELFISVGPPVLSVPNALFLPPLALDSSHMFLTHCSSCRINQRQQTLGAWYTFLFCLLCICFCRPNPTFRLYLGKLSPGVDAVAYHALIVTKTGVHFLTRPASAVWSIPFLQVSPALTPMTVVHCPGSKGSLSTDSSTVLHQEPWEMSVT